MAADIQIYPNHDLNKRAWDPQKVLVFGANDTVKTFNVETPGVLFINSVVKCDNFTNAVTGTLKITDTHSQDIWSQASIARNTTTVCPSKVGSDVWAVVLSGLCTFTYTLTGAPGGNGGNVGVTVQAI